MGSVKPTFSGGPATEADAPLVDGQPARAEPGKAPHSAQRATAERGAWPVCSAHLALLKSPKTVTLAPK
jgi:hypothetical protein